MTESDIYVVQLAVCCSSKNRVNNYRQLFHYTFINTTHLFKKALAIKNNLTTKQYDNTGFVYIIRDTKTHYI